MIVGERTDEKRRELERKKNERKGWLYEFDIADRSKSEWTKEHCEKQIRCLDEAIESLRREIAKLEDIPLEKTYNVIAKKIDGEGKGKTVEDTVTIYFDEDGTEIDKKFNKKHPGCSSPSWFIHFS